MHYHPIPSLQVPSRNVVGQSQKSREKRCIMMRLENPPNLPWKANAFSPLLNLSLYGPLLAQFAPNTSETLSITLLTTGSSCFKPVHQRGTLEWAHHFSHPTRGRISLFVRLFPIEIFPSSPCLNRTCPFSKISMKLTILSVYRWWPRLWGSRPPTWVLGRCKNISLLWLLWLGISSHCRRHWTAIHDSQTIWTNQARSCYWLPSSDRRPPPSLNCSSNRNYTTFPIRFRSTEGL